jgi:dynein heavy chain
MISAEKESVLFNTMIDVNEGERKGNVEKWLLDIEKMMIETLIKINKDCMCDEKTPRTKWV